MTLFTIFYLNLKFFS